MKKGEKQTSVDGNAAIQICDFSSYFVKRIFDKMGSW